MLFEKTKSVKIRLILTALVLLISLYSPVSHDNPFLRESEPSYSGVNGEEFNGIDTFASDSVGSNPWTIDSAGIGKIIASKTGHSKVYELDWAGRRRSLSNDMTSDWTIEFYIMFENLGPGTGASVITLVGSTGQWIRFGYYQCDGFWGKDWSGSGGKTNIQSAENWSSNSWMHWRITWDALGKNFAFYVNDTLLTTHHYTVLGSLNWFDLDAYNWGDPGMVWFDSFSWSWHPNYYSRMIFDIGVEYDGIYTFDTYAAGSDPWEIVGTVVGTANILRTFNGHSFVYQLDNAARRVYTPKSMTTDFKIETYISLSELSHSGTGAAVLYLRGLNGNYILWGYDKVLGDWVRKYSGGTTQVMLTYENWTSNSWMYWRVEFTSASNTWKFYINNSLLDTVVYSGINILNTTEFTCGSWGDAGQMRIDSLCYSWHPSYYNKMLFHHGPTELLPEVYDGGREFNGIETFSTEIQNSDPWFTYSIGSAKIKDLVVQHSKVYELENASRGLLITNDMNSDWAIESYIMIENVGAGSGCIMLNLYGPSNIRMQYGYNQSGGYWAKNYTGISESNSIQEAENWSSNSWMHWRVTWTASSDDFKFYVNDTLLDTHNYPTFTSLVGVAVDGNCSGDSGKTWIDSFSWSWHAVYYDRMVFDLIGTSDADSDGMPNLWERDNGFNPHLASDASGDADGDGLSNLNEYLNDTDPNDPDSDDDTHNDKVEIDAGKDPNNPYSYPGFEYYGFETNTVPSAWNVYSDTGVLQVGELTSGLSVESRKFLRWTVSGYWDRLKVSSINSIAAEVDFWINIHTYGNSGTYPERGLSIGVWNSAYSYAVNTISWGSNGLYRMVAGVATKIADYTINTWYHVRFTWNCSAGFSEVSINDEFITSWAINTYGSYSQFSFLNSMNVQPRYVDIDEFYSDNKNVDLDNDGMPSYYEVENGLDPADESDNVTDLDSDFLLNIYEFGNLTDPNDSDTDDDLLEDGEEVLTYFTNPNDTDSDDDSLNDYVEVIMYGTDPNDPDSDDDILNDYEEIITYGSDPNDPDSDDDLLNDYAEAITYDSDPNDPDSDDDTLNDYEEAITHNTDPNDPDSDDDTIDDATEINTHGTDPNAADSDDDQLNDAAEINIHGTDPNDPDSDDDLLTDAAEINSHGTDPNDADSDNDGYSDKQEVDFGTDPNNSISYPGYIALERLLGFFILLSVAVAVGITGFYITKKQTKRRFI